MQYTCYTWVNQLPGHVIKAADFFFLGSMDYHGGGAQDTEQAAKLPMQVQPLRQEVWRQDRTAMTFTVRQGVSTSQIHVQCYFFRVKTFFLNSSKVRFIIKLKDIGKCHAVSCVYLTSTLSAPSGVTRVAGAKAYAAKLAASPAPTVIQWSEEC